MQDQEKQRGRDRDGDRDTEIEKDIDMNKDDILTMTMAVIVKNKINQEQEEHEQSQEVQDQTNDLPEEVTRFTSNTHPTHTHSHLTRTPAAPIISELDYGRLGRDDRSRLLHFGPQSIFATQVHDWQIC